MDERNESNQAHQADYVPRLHLLYWEISELLNLRFFSSSSNLFCSVLMASTRRRSSRLASNSLRISARVLFSTICVRCWINFRCLLSPDSSSHLHMASSGV